MTTSKIFLALTCALACLGCTDKRPPSTEADTSPASAASAAASAVMADARSAPDAASQPAAPIAIEYYAETDALRLMPPIPFVRFKTNAGTLYCAVGLCAEAPADPDDKDSPFSYSYHTVKWTLKGAAVGIQATTDPSADPTYLVDGRQIAGEDAYVPGDGCLYVRQSGDAYFPVTKRYCAGANGKLERMPQKDDVFPLAHTANFKASMQVFEAPDSRRVVDVVPEGEQLFVMAARVQGLDDYTDAFSWLQVRTKRHQVGWIPMPESIDQCDDVNGNQKKICFLGD
jgi:hypothetical protein